jgi:hypothetical protein
VYVCQSLESAARGRREELEQLSEALVLLRAEWESALAELTNAQSKLTTERANTAAAIQVSGRLFPPLDVCFVVV